MLAVPGWAAVAGDSDLLRQTDSDGGGTAEVEVGPRSSAALIPLAERHQSIILHLSFICAATIWGLAALSSPVGAPNDEQASRMFFFFFFGRY